MWCFLEGWRLLEKEREREREEREDEKACGLGEEEEYKEDGERVISDIFFFFPLSHHGFSILPFLHISFDLCKQKSFGFHT